MKILFTHDSPQGRDKSKYFETLTADLVRLYGQEKGLRLAHRWWDIRNLKNLDSDEERTRIVMGLA
jgi:hypothetical protein